MKKKFSVITILIMVLTMTVIFSACGNGGGGSASGPRAIPNEARIIEELNNNTRSPITRPERVDNIEIISDETDTDAGRYEAFVKVFSSDDEIAFIKFIRIIYQRNEDKEWILSNASFDTSRDWTSTPLVGVKEVMVKDTIMGALLIINEDEWQITEQALESFSIINQETNLQQNRDAITISMTLKDYVLSATGEMLVEFKFNDGWVFSEYRVSTPFTTSVHNHAVLNLNESDLLSHIIGQSMIYSAVAARTAEEIKMEQDLLDMIGKLSGFPFISLLGGFLHHDPTAQSLSISNDEVSNFMILSMESSERGTIQKYYSSFILNKKLVDFEVLAEIIYNFDNINGWLLYDIGLIPIVNAFKLEGTKWVGVYNPNNMNDPGNFLSGRFRFEMDITEVTHIGTIDSTIHATLNLYPEAWGSRFGDDSIADYSQSSKGFANHNELTISLSFDEWIIEPPRFQPPRLWGTNEWLERTEDRINIFAWLNAENSKLSGKTGMNNMIEAELDRSR